ncbi:TetR/AcrR family transcriptional regulator [Cyanobacteria bacterium FACHB-DQ100]|uniref:TetR/AcrR family transcriptional regulator n=1 Tax=Leptolyngbya sp. DQ-M1 TaxID=2933920 RepID=UPI0019B7F327|nr:TetR/AcrR family transcriptional regulator [Cyanobacteria bacterium FACHB-DQ100]
MVNLKRTREDILSSVIELIHHQGFQSTGLKELFAASNTSSGSFYNYFQSKNELAHALIDYKWSQIKAVIIEPAQQISDPIAQVFDMIDRLEAKHQSEPDCGGCFLGNLIVDLAKHDPSFQEHLIQVFDAWQAAIAQSLQAGKSALKPEINPVLLAEQVLTQIEGVLLMSRLYNQPARLKRSFDMVRQTVQSALR